MSERAWQVIGGLSVSVLGLVAVVLSQTLAFKNGEAADVVGLIGFVLFFLGGCSVL